jgi:hypothetical protein
MAQLAFSMQQAHHMQEDDHRDGNAEDPEEDVTAHDSCPRVIVAPKLLGNVLDGLWFSVAKLWGVIAQGTDEALEAFSLQHRSR